jgi:hypothetical protein
VVVVIASACGKGWPCIPVTHNPAIWDISATRIAFIFLEIWPNFSKSIFNGYAEISLFYILSIALLPPIIFATSCNRVYN